MTLATRSEQSPKGLYTFLRGISQGVGFFSPSFRASAPRPSDYRDHTHLADALWGTSPVLQKMMTRLLRFCVHDRTDIVGAKENATGQKLSGKER